MDKEIILENLTGIFSEVLNDGSIVINEESSPADVVGWTSLTNMALITAIENKFKVRFKLKDMMSIQKVGDIVRVLTKYLNAD